MIRTTPATDVVVHTGPDLLAAHHEGRGDLPRLDLADLLAALAHLRGRGGAAFPFARKLETAARGRRRPVVIVNASEGEPASAKDAALLTHRPHLVLDGAIVAARALGTREVHVVLPHDRPVARARMIVAADERSEVRIQLHTAAPRFVSGQARAVVELVSGRENLPVTAWSPEAVAGVRGRPTLLSNAETWAHVGATARRGGEPPRTLGTPDEPGTVLLTLTPPVGPTQVREVEYGSRLRDALPPASHGLPALVGGFHGTWATWPTLAAARVSVPGLAALGTPLGAGVVLTPAASPLDATQAITAYLAEQSAGRCGPCFNGLPAIAVATRELAHGHPGAADRLAELCGLVAGRGACAHPDGTARLVRSLLTLEQAS
jgi:NADH:ubiquinone oxidoreductase subunit F (NADH-binding)